MSRPTNPNSYWNVVDRKPGADEDAMVPVVNHVIRDTRMREATGEFWTVCECGFRLDAGSAEQLWFYYNGHIAAMKGGK